MIIKHIKTEIMYFFRLFQEANECVLKIIFNKNQNFGITIFIFNYIIEYN